MGVPQWGPRRSEGIMPILLSSFKFKLSVACPSPPATRSFKPTNLNHCTSQFHRTLRLWHAPNVVPLVCVCASLQQQLQRGNIAPHGAEHNSCHPTRLPEHRSTPNISTVGKNREKTSFFDRDSSRDSESFGLSESESDTGQKQTA
jgi:hypothetical protein